MSEREEVLQRYGLVFTGNGLSNISGKYPSDVMCEMAERIVELERALAARDAGAVRERDEVIAACRGTQMDAAGIRTLEELRARLAACVSACESAVEELKCDGHIRTKDEPEYGHWCATCDSHVDVNGTVRDLLRAAVATAQGE